MACRAILQTGYSSEVNYYVLKSNWKEATTWSLANVDRVQVEIRDEKVTQFMVQTVQIKIIIDVLATGYGLLPAKQFYNS